MCHPNPSLRGTYFAFGKVQCQQGSTPEPVHMGSARLSTCKTPATGEVQLAPAPGRPRTAGRMMKSEDPKGQGQDGNTYRWSARPPYETRSERVGCGRETRGGPSPGPYRTHQMLQQLGNEAKTGTAQGRSPDHNRSQKTGHAASEKKLPGHYQPE